jgi:hypothetical protein
VIVVPHTELAAATREAVPEAVFVEVDPVDGYRLLLAELWREGEAFTLVEHDVIPTRAQLNALEECEQPWCHYGYFPGHWTPVFGCVRFSAELIVGTRGVWDDATWPWNQLDMKFATAAWPLGWRAHWHSPHVRHGGTSFVDADGAHRGELPDWLYRWTLEKEAATIREMEAAA